MSCWGAGVGCDQLIHVLLLFHILQICPILLATYQVDQEGIRLSILPSLFPHLLIQNCPNHAVLPTAIIIVVKLDLGSFLYCFVHPSIVYTDGQQIDVLRKIELISIRLHIWQRTHNKDCNAWVLITYSM